MWKSILVLLCISSLFFKFISGEYTAENVLNPNILNTTFTNVNYTNANIKNSYVEKNNVTKIYVPKTNLTSANIKQVNVKLSNDTEIKVERSDVKDVIHRTNVNFLKKPKDMLVEVAPRIVNGTKATEGQFPHQVSLRRRYYEIHFCGGSIVTPCWILSAAHCMYVESNNKYVRVKPSSILIIAGDLNLPSKEYAHQWRYAEKMIVHEKFNMATLRNDVALLKVPISFKFDPHVHELPLARMKMPDYTECQVAGWGYERENAGTVSSSLLYVDVPIIPIDVCRNLMKRYTDVPPGMFCAGHFEGGRDACQGDSGGGLVCRGQLTGVVSGGEGCARPNLPGLYADVKFFIPWIERYVFDLNEEHTGDPYVCPGGSESMYLVSPGLLVFMVLASFIYR